MFTLVAKSVTNQLILIGLVHCKYVEDKFKGFFLMNVTLCHVVKS